MRLCAVVILALFGLVLTSAHSAAQEARSINPEAVEFDSPVLALEGVHTLRVELFMAGADTRRDQPVNTLDVDPRAIRPDGRLRVELTPLVIGVPDGSYVATVRAVSDDQTAQSPPSDAFVLAREGTPEDRAAEEKQERRWTRIGLAIMIGALLVPFAF